MLCTPACDVLGIEVPIVQAAIWPATSPELVAGVSEAAEGCVFWWARFGKLNEQPAPEALENHKDLCWSVLGLLGTGVDKLSAVLI